MKYLKRQAPIAAAAIAGFAVMSLEILGSRLAAPLVGTSILVWTNLIGVILTALAAGAWAGGVLSDKFPQEKIVGYLMLSAGLWSLAMVFASRSISHLMPSLSPDVVAPLFALILLALPAFLLGAVPPALIRLSLKEVTGSGHVAGMLSAAGSVGSLLGTYLTGYVLLRYYAVTELLFGNAILLIIFALLFSGRIMGRRTMASAAGLVILMAPAGLEKPPGLYPSAYNHVLIRDVVYHEEPVRGLFINQGLHAAASPNSLETSALEYGRGLRATDSLVPEPKRLLALGGGGFHLVREFLTRHPEARVDVVEIDPAVALAAQQTFGMKDDPRLHVYLEDARTALDKLTPGYDLIIQDTFAGDLSVPWYLLTEEAFAKYKKLLSPQGIYAANIIMGGQGGGEAMKRFNRDLTATMRTAFDWTGAVSLHNNSTNKAPSNVLIFAGSGQTPDMQNLTAEVVKNATKSQPTELQLLDGGQIWTDDYGPADYESLDMYREARRKS